MVQSKLYLTRENVVIIAELKLPNYNIESKFDVILYYEIDGFNVIFTTTWEFGNNYGLCQNVIERIFQLKNWIF